MELRTRKALAAEWFLLFVGVPTVIFAEVIPASKLLLMAPPVIYAIAVFFVRKGWREEAPPPTDERTWTLKTVLVRFVLLAPVTILITWMLNPEWLFAFPLKDVRAWATVMVAYPFVSALPQEFVYRRFYFWRYRRVFGSEGNLAWTSAVMFGAMHIVYDNPYTIVIALLGGALFTLTWMRSKNVWLTSLEHALYGNLIFTVGIGTLFYEPPPVG